MHPSITRRRFLGGLAAGGAAAALAPTLLTACGDDSSGSSGGKKTVVFHNWPLYIEGDDPATSPTLTGFTKASGLAVDYTTAVEDNDSWFDKFSPDLAKGKGVGVDIVVLTTWMAARMVERKYVQAFDAATFPNKKNVLADLADSPWDKGRTSTIPWAQGQTGIAYWPDKAGFEIKSMADLLDPRLKGRVTLLSEMRDTVGLMMLLDGKKPEDAKVADALAAIEKIKAARDKGQFRKITGNSYTDDLGAQEAWASVAWSGDVAQLQAEKPGLKWVLPAEGAMSFTDWAMILIGAPNKAGAEKLLNYVYDPAVAAGLYESIAYRPPVQGAVEKMSAEAQKNPLINPGAGVKLHEFRVLTADEDKQLAEAFNAATQQ
ncbi:MAG: spermidine/putrescine ABC transporter substrate-binding protein [Acidimicrobiales bacterium]